MGHEYRLEYKTILNTDMREELTSVLIKNNSKLIYWPTY